MSPKKVKKVAAVVGKSAVAVKSTDDVKNTVAVTPKAKGSMSDTYVVIDHPQNNEQVFGQHYAVRIGSSNQGSVEISINDSEWLPCRHSAGYWWFDWYNFTPGKQTLVARLKNDQGKTIKKSAVCKCTVS